MIGYSTDWMEDEKFLLVVAGRLLEALGVSRGSIKALPALQEILQRLGYYGEAKGTNVPAPERLAALSEAERGAFEADVLEAISLALPLARETLAGLEKNRIRLEVLGVSSQGVRTLMREGEAMVDAGAIDEAAFLRASEIIEGPPLGHPEESLDAGNTRYLMGRPAQAARADAKRIVRVFKKLPRDVQSRILPVKNGFLLTSAITFLLRMYRKEWMSPARSTEFSSEIRATLYDHLIKNARMKNADLETYVREFNARNPEGAVDVQEVLRRAAQRPPE